MEKVGRNDPCPCGSGKKFKKCCESKVTKRTIGNAQVLGGSQKMSSLFSRNVKPITPTQPKTDAAPEAEQKPEQDTSASNT